MKVASTVTPESADSYFVGGMGSLSVSVAGRGLKSYTFSHTISARASLTAFNLQGIDFIENSSSRSFLVLCFLSCISINHNKSEVALLDKETYQKYKVPYFDLFVFNDAVIDPGVFCGRCG
jgi:hypothetical protein